MHLGAFRGCPGSRLPGMLNRAFKEDRVADTETTSRLTIVHVDRAPVAEFGVGRFFGFRSTGLGRGFLLGVQEGRGILDLCRK